MTRLRTYTVWTSQCVGQLHEDRAAAARPSHLISLGRFSDVRCRVGKRGIANEFVSRPLPSTSSLSRKSVMGSNPIRATGVASSASIAWASVSTGGSGGTAPSGAL